MTPNPPPPAGDDFDLDFTKPAAVAPPPPTAQQLESAQKEVSERARSLPVALRVYHCVVLPSALMVRAPASYGMEYDPVSLKMRAGLGWTAQDLQRECEHVAERARAEGGRSGEYFWIFPPPGEPY